MITVFPADEAELARLNAAAHTAYTGGMVLCEDGVQKGYWLFSFAGDTVELGEPVCADPLLYDGLLRASLNCGYNAGLKQAVYRGSDQRSRLGGYGFFERDGAVTVSLAAFFGMGCHGEKKP